MHHHPRAFPTFSPRVPSPFAQTQSAPADAQLRWHKSPSTRSSSSITYEYDRMRLVSRTSTTTILPTLLELRRHRPLLGRRTLLVLQRCREGAGGPLWVGRRLGGAGEPVCARTLGRAGAACKRARSAEPALSSAGVTQSRMGFLGVLLRFAPRAMFVTCRSTYKVVVTTRFAKVGYQCT